MKVLSWFAQVIPGVDDFYLLVGALLVAFLFVAIILLLVLRAMRRSGSRGATGADLQSRLQDIAAPESAVSQRLPAARSATPSASVEVSPIEMKLRQLQEEEENQQAERSLFDETEWTIEPAGAAGTADWKTEPAATGDTTDWWQESTGDEDWWDGVGEEEDWLPDPAAEQPQASAAIPSTSETKDDDLFGFSSASDESWFSTEPAGNTETDEELFDFGQDSDKATFTWDDESLEIGGDSDMPNLFAGDDEPLEMNSDSDVPDLYDGDDEPPDGEMDLDALFARLELEPEPPPDLLQQIEARTFLEQVNQFTLHSKGTVQERPDEMSLTWPGPAGNHTITIEVLDPDTLAINGQQFPASPDGVKQGIVATLKNKNY